MASSRMLVAPREIADLVDRASRVHGCTVADAGRLAADVTFCEIHHGGGLAAWLDLANGGPGALTAAVDAARALDRIALDVLETDATGAGAQDPAVEQAVEQAGEGAVEHRLAEPVPFALLARSRAAWAQRGVAAAVTAEPGTAEHRTAEYGTDAVRAVRVRAAEPVDRPDDERRRRDALALGIAVDRAEWQQLDVAGAAFLMSEAVLDAAAHP